MNSNMKEQTKKYFYIGGFNCAETTLSLIRDSGAVSIDDEAIKMMTGFGGGITKGYLCGAIVAGVAAIGILYGRTSPDGDREKSKKMINSYMEKFSGKYNKVNCNDLISDFETKTEEQYNYCKNIVETSVSAFLETINNDTQD